MAKKTQSNQKHMTQDDRVTIENCLDSKATPCHKHYPDFIPYDYHCKLTDKAPYVCNGCQKKAQCRLDKYFYRATKAQDDIILTPKLLKGKIEV